ncbi:MAG: hypothetical protein FJ399_10685, partial [Verrucomicrobia bacterium]|nr:hypothetical protein [Verrucomicrobiota bacterium]
MITSLPGSAHRMLASAFLIATGGFAQAIDPAPRPSTAVAATAEPVVELSPFEVTASTATPWVATETLAGTRLRTNLKD